MVKLNTVFGKMVSESNGLTTLILTKSTEMIELSAFKVFSIKKKIN